MYAPTVRFAFFSLIVVLMVTATTATAQTLPEALFPGSDDDALLKFTEPVLRAGCCTLRGDANCDGVLTVTDLRMIINCIIWLSWPDCICCPEHADLNGDGIFKVSDLTMFINYLFKGGPAPAPCPPQ